MAVPGPKLKQGLDYFPMETGEESRFDVITNLYGDTGYKMLSMLLRKIHGDKGYYMKWNERQAKLFAGKHNWKYETLAEVIKDCFIEGILNEEKFIEHGILTSEEIQKVWIHVVKERKEIIYNPDYLLIDISRYLKDKQETSSEPSLPLPDEFFLEDLENEPEINSNNLTDNSNNTSDNSQGKEVKQEEEVKQAKELKEGEEGSERSEALNFSHSAEFNSPLKKMGEISDEKILQEKIRDRELQEREISGRKDEENTNQPENSAGKNSRNVQGKQEKLFEEPANSGTSNTKTSAKKRNHTASEKQSGKHRNQPHPVRSQIISLWEIRFGQPYENTHPGNIAINQIIRHLDNLIRRAREGDIQDENVHLRIVELWQVLLNNWDKLQKFYRNLIQFESIAKYLAEIINQLREHGTHQKQSTSANTNGAKPSFDRFRK